jgi:PhnB protein
MTGLVPYLLLPGTARAALTRYAEIFGGELTLHSYEEFGRDDGPADAIAHGTLSGVVTLFAADVGGDARIVVRGARRGRRGARTAAGARLG